MTTGLLLTALCALAWAGMDALRKVLAGRIEPLPLAGLLTLGQLPVYGAWAAWEGRLQVSAGYWLPGLLDVACNLVAQVLFVTAVRASPLSRVVPMLAFTPVFAIATGALVLGERPTPWQGLGVLGVVLGAMILQLRRDDLSDPARFLGAWVREPGVPMMLGVAALWSLTMVLDKLCLTQASVPSHALLHVAGMATGILLLLAGRGRLSALGAARAHWRPYLAAILVVGLATASQYFAIRTMLVSEVEAIKRATGLAGAVLNGWLLFGEPVTSAKLLAIAVMASGVVAVVLGG
ncbi:MAG: DMT family transporter [Alphaproteobacteria bacterium]|nr:DMT family transporter [Alphaproteobacteria bacterium]MCB9792127.1 DMT family transporter [Alphaproteobacteria bacterium]